MTRSSEPAPIDGLIDGKGLAHRLGVSQSTIRSWKNRGVSWLPDPIGRLDGFVWREQDVAKIQAEMPPVVQSPKGRPGPARSDRHLQLPERKARGAYYTPGDAAHFMASWIVRRGGETYLEPSLGDGVLVEAVRDVVEARTLEAPRWVAHELDAATAMEASQRGLLSNDELRIGDFLDHATSQVDAVLANPPYVRLRHLSEDSRNKALAAAREYLGASMAPSGSIWMPFVLKMVASVRPGGRMAVVLPLDFTYVAYALPLWAHLASSFSSIQVLRSRERVFPELNQDVLILLADGRGGTTEHVDYTAHETLKDMVSGANAVGGEVKVASIVSGERAFQRALLPEGLEELLAEASVTEWTIPAAELATFRIGYVSGNKNYFHPGPETVNRYRLPPSSLQPALVNARKARSQGLRTSGFDDHATDQLWLPVDNLTAGEKRYVRDGEVAKVHEGYKASLRKPWFRVPGVKSPDAIVSVFSERPLVLVNDAEWVSTNSFLCVYTHSVSADEFAAAWYNPLTLLSIGLEVHSLGGGVMVMVPSEASRVAVLNPSKAAGDLDQIDAALRRGDIAEAYGVGSKIMANAFGHAGKQLIELGTNTLSQWRTR